MNFLASIAVSATTPDPRSAPATVPAELVFAVKGQMFGIASDYPTQSILVALDGTSGNTATFELWALDESMPAPAEFPSVFKPASTDLWYKLVAATAVSVGSSVLFQPVAAGRLYLRCTVAPAAAATVKVAPLPRA